MDKNFSKLMIWRDVTISYGAGIAGALVVLFSLDNNNSLQPNVFWSYVLIIYFALILILFFITKIFRNQ